MTYRETLPEGCPPPDSHDIKNDKLIFRLVSQLPPVLDDFRSQRAMKPQARFSGVSECQACGLSVYTAIHDCEKVLKLPRFNSHHVCCVQLIAGAGNIQHTGANSHHTWWPKADFDILLHCVEA